MQTFTGEDNTDLGGIYRLIMEVSETSYTETNASFSYTVYLYGVQTGTTAGNYYNYNNGNSLTITLNGSNIFSTANVGAVTGVMTGVKCQLYTGTFTLTRNTSTGVTSGTLTAQFVQTQQTAFNPSCTGTVTGTTVLQKNMYVYTGSTWVLASEVNLYSGSTWKTESGKTNVYTGSAWK